METQKQLAFMDEHPGFEPGQKVFKPHVYRNMTYEGPPISHYIAEGTAVVISGRMWVETGSIMQLPGEGWYGSREDAMVFIADEMERVGREMVRDSLKLRSA